MCDVEKIVTVKLLTSPPPLREEPCSVEDTVLPTTQRLEAVFFFLLHIFEHEPIF